MPRAHRYSKNERTLRLELARVARRLHKSEEKRDAVLERYVDQLTQDRNQQARRAREAQQAARRALELVLQAQAQAAQARAEQAAQARARRTSVCQAAAVCMFTVVAPLLFRL